MTVFVRRELERVRHLQGERLRGRDFRAQVAIDDQLRWWHNRALHRAYGVATGLDVRDPATMMMPPAAGATTVEIGPGVAYDAYGREIVNPFPALRDVPADDSTLVVSYRPPVRAEPPPRSPAACPSDCDSGGGTTAVFAWVAPATAPSREAVPLVTFRGGRVEVHTTFAHAMARPLVASGETRLGFTPWAAWTDGKAGSLGLQTDVDTSAALFKPELPVPCYFAWLNEVIDTDPAQPQIPPPRGFLAHVAPGADHRKFTFRVLMRKVALIDQQTANLIGSSGVWLPFAKQLQVCWVGVQCLTCTPHDPADNSGE